MRTTKNKRWNSLLMAGTVVVITGIMACNSSDYGNADSSSANNTDTVAANNETNAANPGNTDATAANKPAKAKKGKASISMNTSRDNTSTVAAPAKDKEGVYSRADVMPAYPGGETALQEFVENNVNYPQSAMDGDVEGTVRVSFVVDEKGMVTKPQVQGVSNPGNGLDQEALRVVKQMPKWTPGMVKGKPVKTRLELPIVFKLSET